MNIKIRCVFFVMLWTGIYSCDLINIEDPVTVSTETLSAKWMAEDSGHNIRSLEFNEQGAYIIVATDSLKSSGNEVYYIGNYQIKSSGEIELEDFGTIRVKSLNSKNAAFTITLPTGNKKEVKVIKGEIISESSRTKEICKIWKREPFDQGSFLYGYELRILFSNSGTYFVTLIDPEGNSMGSLNYWKWKDSQEENVCFSNSSAFSCDGINEFQVIDLNSSMLKIKHPDETIETYHYTSLLK